MRLLLDTCVFLWFISDDPKLSKSLKSFIADPEQEVFLSVVSPWETILKQQTGRLSLPPPIGGYLREKRELHRIAPLLLEEQSVLHLVKLPPLHRDPFDRMLICQAMEHNLTIVTPDHAISQYPIKTLWEFSEGSP